MSRARESARAGASDAPERAEPAAFERVLARALERNHLHESFRGLVVDMWRRRDEQWRVCCGSACAPCIEAVGRAVDELREEFGHASD